MVAIRGSVGPRSAVLGVARVGNGYPVTNSWGKLPNSFRITSRGRHMKMGRQVPDCWFGHVEGSPKGHLVLKIGVWDGGGLVGM